MVKNKLKGIWRLIQPLKTFGLRHPYETLKSYTRFYYHWKEYKKLGGILSFRNVAPILNIKKEDSQTGGGHYFYQDIWALRKVSELKPEMHYDVGSRFDGFTGQLTSICPVTCIDIRR